MTSTVIILILFILFVLVLLGFLYSGVKYNHKLDEMRVRARDNAARRKAAEAAKVYEFKRHG